MDTTIADLYPATIFRTIEEAEKVVAGWPQDGTWAIVETGGVYKIAWYEEKTGAFIGFL